MITAIIDGKRHQVDADRMGDVLSGRGVAHLVRALGDNFGQKDFEIEDGDRRLLNCRIVDARDMTAVVVWLTSAHVPAA